MGGLLFVKDCQRIKKRFLNLKQLSFHFFTGGKYTFEAIFRHSLSVTVIFLLAKQTFILPWFYFYLFTRHSFIILMCKIISFLIICLVILIAVFHMFSCSDVVLNHIGKFYIFYSIFCKLNSSLTLRSLKISPKLAKFRFKFWREFDDFFPWRLMRLARWV